MATNEAQAKRAAALEMKRGNVEKAKSILAPFTTNTSKSTPTSTPSRSSSSSTRSSNSLINDQLKQTTAYQNLISKGFTEEQISERVGQMTPEQQRTIMGYGSTTPTTTQTPEPSSEPTSVVGTTPEQEQRANLLEAQREAGLTNKDRAINAVEDVRIEDIIPKFGYETTISERQDRNQKIAEGLFGQNKTLNEDKIFDEIKTLAPNVTEGEIMNTVRDIRDRFNRLKRLDEISTMDSQTIANWISSGQLQLGDIDGLKVTDPTKWAEITGFISQNNKLSEYNSALSDMSALFGDSRIDTAFGYLDEVNKNYINALNATDGEDALQTYQDALNDPDLLEKREQLTQKEGEIKELDLQLNDLRREVEDEFGSTASKSLINAVVADRGADLLRQKNSLLVESQTLATSVNNSITQAQQNYDLDLKQEMMQRENIIQSYGMTMDMFDRQWSELTRQMEKEDQRELQMLSLYEQLDLSKVTEGQIDSLQASNWIKDYLKLKKEMPNEITSTFGQGGAMYGMDKYGNVSQILGGSSTYNDGTFSLEMDIQRPAGSTNVGRDVNNPGNITADGFSSPEGKADYGRKIGAVGTYKSPNGREYYVFDTPEAGAAALRDFAQRIVSGNSSSYDPNMTMKEFVKTYTGNYNSGYLKVLEQYAKPSSGIVGVGFDSFGDVKVGTLDAGSLAEGLARADSNMDISGLGMTGVVPTATATQTGGLGDDAQNILFGGDIKDIPIADRSGVITEIRQWFEANKDQFYDENEYLIRKSVLQTKDLTDSPKDKLMSINNVKFQLENLEDALNSQDTGPLRELWEKSADKWTDQDTAALRAQLEAIVPDLARGVFGEKGVLTDTDIERYRKTIPNLGNRNEVNAAIAQNLKDILKNTFLSTITTQAKSNVNVSNFADDYLYRVGANGGMSTTTGSQYQPFIDYVEGNDIDSIIDNN